ncbi:DUF421 domain-containing protein [Hymenobacter sp. HSC-4F20]|uniref:YetF domain-containing protein n=1 Tax=Hymenobacter sp. HSC-4F20 TaxID=2864135 RepID=UPI001C731F69|nr:YetF domain-containing protein [Hymenobacter sp. HSC-4F20]MBX0288844.1 DUF421 domain-containing protein [Hymenobacter sp. HSC-4F20]
MKKEDIHLGDWQRILFGDAPAAFTVEVLVRTLLIYVIFLLIMRLMGKRMNAQLTITELAVMVSLGAIVSVPMQIPNRGLLPAVVLLLVVLFFQRGLNWLALKKRKTEVLLQGDVTLLAKNGVLQVEQLRAESVSHEQLYAQLRAKKITHLGEVKRVYMEADGSFSVFRQDPPQPGLSVLPEQDQKLRDSQSQPASAPQVCNYCGHLATPSDHSGRRCPTCGHEDWVAAVC